MRKIIIMLFTVLVFLSGSFAFADPGKNNWDILGELGLPSGGSWTAGNNSASASVDSVKKGNHNNNHSKREIDLKALYEEFEKFWYVKNEEDRQDRFEEFLRTKNLDPDDLEGYDEFLEETFHVYDLESLYDEFERNWDFEDGDDFQDRFEEFLVSKNIDPDDIEDYDDFIDAVYEGDLDWDDFDRIYDDDIDDFADDYLNDYPDDDFYEDYGEYFDEVYYD